MLRGMLLGVCAAASASSATAEPSPLFAESPSEAEIQAAYPREALAAGWGGWVALTCTHDAEGALTDCRAVGSDHRYKGFKEAGLQLVPKFRLDMAGPARPPKTVNMTIRFVPSPDRPEREPRFGKFDSRFRYLAPIGPYWPEYAVRTRTTGWSVIDCKVDDDRRLKECRFIAEEPVGQDLRSAALRMTASGFLTAGPPVAGAVEPKDGFGRITVEFKAPKNWN